MINAYAQNLGIQSLEFAGVGFIRRDLARSDGCPGEWEKHQDYVFSQVVTELYVLIQMGWKSKIRSGLSYKELHGLPPFERAILPH